MNIKSWFNSNAWYEASSQHYAKATVHTNYTILALELLIGKPLLQKLSHPITRKIKKTAKRISNPIGESIYTTENNITQYYGLGSDTEFFRVRSSSQKNSHLVFSYSNKPGIYYFPLTKGTDKEYKEYLKQSRGLGIHDSSVVWRSKEEGPFRECFPDKIRENLEIHEAQDQRHHRYHTITPEDLRDAGLTIDEAPITHSETIKYNESDLWKITAILGSCIIKVAVNIIVAAALQYTLNLIMHLVQAAINGDSLEDAAYESWQETKAIGHAFLAAGDYAGWCVCKLVIDTPLYLANGIWHQTLGLFGHNEENQDTVVISGDITDTSSNASVH